MCEGGQAVSQALVSMQLSLTRQSFGSEWFLPDEEHSFSTTQQMAALLIIIIIIIIIIVIVIIVFWMLHKPSPFPFFMTAHVCMERERFIWSRPIITMVM